jgi:hypothetical protein
VLSTPPAFILSQDQTLRSSQTLLAHSKLSPCGCRFKLTSV